MKHATVRMNPSSRTPSSRRPGCLEDEDPRRGFTRPTAGLNIEHPQLTPPRPLSKLDASGGPGWLRLSRPLWRASKEFAEIRRWLAGAHVEAALAGDLERSARRVGAPLVAHLG